MDITVIHQTVNKSVISFLLVKLLYSKGFLETACRGTCFESSRDEFT
jgi:hypothetical protein